MKADNVNQKVHRSLFSARRYIMFFLLISFVVTTSFLLFLRTLGVTITDVRSSAIITFCNIVFLTLLFTVCDSLRYMYMVERPMRRILQATQQLTQGDFSVRIQPLHGLERMNEFDVIITDFNKMAEELSSIETLRTDFIASVSHELKTPLAVMQNYATMLQAPNLTADQRIEYAHAIADAARRLSELITNILRLNKLENQNIFPDKIQYNLGEQLRECVLALEDLWEKKDLQLEIAIDDVLIEADAELLTLVWNNLLSNAMKFTEDGGTIAVTVTENSQWAVVSIADTGCGISAEVGRHIFEKFYQGDSSHATQGNGLGLALVKRVVDIIGGEISVESSVGVGSTFTVRLPK